MILGVSDFTALMKRHISEVFFSIQIRGEILQITHSSRGNTYLVLKEGDAILNAVYWKNTKLECAPEKGMELVFSGSISIYQSRYQLNITSAQIYGTGNLAKVLETRKKKLTEEGLFDETCKKNLTMLPKSIGLITSKHGAVLHDMLNRIQVRIPVKVMLYDVPVQGSHAAQKVIKAIEYFNKTDVKPEVLILARGGGSLEDLWTFNEEAVIRAIYRSEIPVVSAIGHETDVTLVDHASDVSAPTPTAAIEIVLPKRGHLVVTVSTLLVRAKNRLKIQMQEKSMLILKLIAIKSQLMNKISLHQEQCDHLLFALRNRMRHNLYVYQKNLEEFVYLINLVQKGGVAFVYDEDGRRIKALTPHHKIKMFFNGKTSICAVVETLG